MASVFAGVGVFVGALVGLLPGVGEVWTKRGLVVAAVVVAACWQVRAGGTSNAADLLAALAVGLVVGPQSGAQSGAQP